MALTHNDMLLILDEMSEMDSKKIGDSVYMLANGKGKTRANIFGEARKKFRWRMGVLSAGEIDLATHMAEAEKKTRAGQEIRLLPISAKPTENSAGIFETIHHFKSADIFANYIKEATNKYYGSAMIKFVEKAVEDCRRLKKYYDDGIVQAVAKHLPTGAKEQDARVFRVFFLIGFAGELATRYGVTGWPTGEALSAALKCFNAWLEEKEGVGNQEERQTLEQVKLFFSTYAQNKFQRIEGGKTFDDYRMSERAGYVESENGRDLYYAFPDYFKRHISKGRNVKATIKMLVDIGIMETDSNGDYYARKRINGKQHRMYVVNDKIFE
jgi:uncharacterized protein (DUF927 family)